MISPKSSPPDTIPNLPSREQETDAATDDKAAPCGNKNGVGVAYDYGFFPKIVAVHSLCNHNPLQRILGMVNCQPDQVTTSQPSKNFSFKRILSHSLPKEATEPQNIQPVQIRADEEDNISNSPPSAISSTTDMGSTLRSKTPSALVYTTSPQKKDIWTEAIPQIQAIGNEIKSSSKNPALSTACQKDVQHHSSPAAIVRESSCSAIQNGATLKDIELKVGCDTPQATPFAPLMPSKVNDKNVPVPLMSYHKSTISNAVTSLTRQSQRVPATEGVNLQSTPFGPAMLKVPFVPHQHITVTSALSSTTAQSQMNYLARSKNGNGTSAPTSIRQALNPLNKEGHIPKGYTSQYKLPSASTKKNEIKEILTQIVELKGRSILDTNGKIISGRLPEPISEVLKRLGQLCKSRKENEGDIWKLCNLMQMTTEMMNRCSRPLRDSQMTLSKIEVQRTKLLGLRMTLLTEEGALHQRLKGLLKDALVELKVKNEEMEKGLHDLEEESEFVSAVAGNQELPNSGVTHLASSDDPNLIQNIPDTPENEAQNNSTQQRKLQSSLERLRQVLSSSINILQQSGDSSITCSLAIDRKRGSSETHTEACNHNSETNSKCKRSRKSQPRRLSREYSVAAKRSLLDEHGGAGSSIDGTVKKRLMEHTESTAVEPTRDGTISMHAEPSLLPSKCQFVKQEMPETLSDCQVASTTNTQVSPNDSGPNDNQNVPSVSQDEPTKELLNDSQVTSTTNIQAISKDNGAIDQPKDATNHTSSTCGMRVGMYGSVTTAVFKDITTGKSTTLCYNNPSHTESTFADEAAEAFEMEVFGMGSDKSAPPPPQIASVNTLAKVFVETTDKDTFTVKMTLDSARKQRIQSLLKKQSELISRLERRENMETGFRTDLHGVRPN